MEGNANAYIFGPLLWALLQDAAVLTDKHPSYKDMYLRLLTDLRQSFPCSHCRSSFGIFLSQAPPELSIERQETREWIHWLHQQVNLKLERTDIVRELSYDRFLLRASVWNAFGSLPAFWDFVSILAITPRADPGVLVTVLDTVRVFMWFAGAHPGYGAPELLKLAEAPAPDSVTNETIFRWVCQQRAAFYQAPENEEAYRKQYRRAIAEEAPAPAP